MNCQGYRPYANTKRGTDRVPNYMHPTFPWLYNTSKGGEKRKAKLLPFSLNQHTWEMQVKYLETVNTDPRARPEAGARQRCLAPSATMEEDNSHV